MFMLTTHLTREMIVYGANESLKAHNEITAQEFATPLKT